MIKNIESVILTARPFAIDNILSREWYFSREWFQDRLNVARIMIESNEDPIICAERISVNSTLTNDTLCELHEQRPSFGSSCFDNECDKNGISTARSILTGTFSGSSMT